MGKELNTTIKCGREKATCKVMLETSQIIVRGDIKRRFPLASLRKLAARGGWLEFESAGERVSIKLDGDAAAWIDRIKNPPSRTQKLRLAAGMKACVLGVAEAGVVDEIAKATGRKPVRALVDNTDVVMLFAELVADLRRLREIERRLSPKGATWVLWPKGGGELRHESVVEAAAAVGLEQTISIGFSERLTGLRLSRPAKKE
jgi:hypothetical protein